MSAPLHTSGPWVYYSGSRSIWHADMKAICTVHGARKSPTEEQAAETEANARLIAAAPELLAHLHGIVSRWALDADEDIPQGVADARALIARVTGAAS